MAAKTARKCKVKLGCAPHYEPNPDFDNEEPEGPDNLRDVEYLPGQVVKTAKRDLVQVFGKEKFEYADLTEEEKDNPLDEKDVKGRDGTTDLEAAANAQRMTITAKDVADARARAEAMAEQVEESGSDETAPDYGDDVTDEFDGAKDAGLMVRKDADGTYRAFDAEEPEKPMKGSKAGFTKKTDVVKFLKKNMA